MMPMSLGGEQCVFQEVQSSGSTICRAVLHQQRGETCVWGVHNDVGTGECKSNLFFGVCSVFQDHRAMCMLDTHCVYVCISFNGKHGTFRK